MYLARKGCQASHLLVELPQAEKTWESCHGLSSLWFWKLHALTFTVNLTEAGCKHDVTLEKLLFHVYMGTHRAAAPEMISISSLVMTAWRVRLNVKVNLSIISARINEGGNLSMEVFKYRKGCTNRIPNTLVNPWGWSRVSLHFSVSPTGNTTQRQSRN